MIKINSTAIIRFLSEKNKLYDWYPTDVIARAKTNQYFCWSKTSLVPQVNKYLNETVWKVLQDQIPKKDQLVNFYYYNYTSVNLNLF